MPPPAPAAPKQLNNIDLLKSQNEDGSWNLDSTLTTIVKKKTLQIKAACTAAIRKLRDQNLFLPSETEDVEKLFATILACEFLTNNLTKEQKQSEDYNEEWKIKAENYIKPRTKEHLEHMKSHVTQFLQGNRTNGTTICKTCKEKRPALLKKCPNCFFKDNEQYQVKEGSKKEYSLSISECKPLKSLDHIEWNQLKGCHWIPGGLGSFGVIVVELPDSQLVIGKCAGNRFIPEYFGNKLAQKIGLNTPKMKILSRLSGEGQNFIHSIESAPFTNFEDSQRIGKYHLFPKFFVMEFIRSDCCLIINHEKAISFLENSKFISQLSKMMAFDILINNYDRIPFIWNNDGNPGNVLIQFEDEENNFPRIFSIDQFVTEIQNSLGKQKYEDSIAKFISICKYIDENSSLNDEYRSYFSKFKEFFLFNLQVDLTDDHIIDFCKNTFSELKQMCDFVLSLSIDDVLGDDETADTKALFVGDTSLDFVKSIAKTCKNNF